MVSSNCALRTPIFSQDFPSEVEHFCFYATADVKPTSPRFQDKTIFGASDVVSSVALTLGTSQVCENCCGSLPTDSERSKANCCSAAYNSEKCLTSALSFYHRAICGQNYDWLFEGIRKHPYTFRRQTVLHGFGSYPHAFRAIAIPLIIRSLQGLYLTTLPDCREGGHYSITSFDLIKYSNNWEWTPSKTFVTTPGFYNK